MARLIDEDALKAKANADPDSGEWFVWVQDIDEAPTVDAVKVVRCRDCKHYDNSEGIQYRMKRLTIRLEDGQAVMNCDTCSRSGNICTLMACRNRLKDRLCDYEDVMQQNRLVELKHGQWEEWHPPMHMILTGEEKLYLCSCCYARLPDVEGYRYCPYCGAKMDGGAYNETD